MAEVGPDSTTTVARRGRRQTVTSWVANILICTGCLCIPEGVTRFLVTQCLTRKHLCDGKARFSQPVVQLPFCVLCCSRSWIPTLTRTPRGEGEVGSQRISLLHLWQEQEGAFTGLRNGVGL